MYARDELLFPTRFWIEAFLAEFNATYARKRDEVCTLSMIMRCGIADINTLKTKKIFIK